MKKEFIDNLMVQMKTLQTKLDDEIEREKIKEEELKVNDWRTKNYISMHSFCPLIIITSHIMKSGWDVFKNMSCTGPIDMVTYHRENNQIILLDAKSSESSAYAELGKCIHKGIYTCWFDEKKQKVIIIKGQNECIEI